MFKKATKSQSKLRLALLGPTGAGKTYTALALTAGRKVAVIDTEHGSAAKYADKFDFDVLNLTNHHPHEYIKAIYAAEAAGYDVVIVDSMTHAWKATQDLVDQETTRSKSGNSFQAWGKVTPIWQDLIQAIVTSKIHVVVTMRSKIEWVIEENERGKKTPKKIGTKPDNRDGAEYEFDVVIELDQEHNAWPSKTRCAEIDGKTWKNPTSGDLGATLFGWLESGAPAPVTGAFNGTTPHRDFSDKKQEAAPATESKAAAAATNGATTTASPNPHPWTPEQKAEAKKIATAIRAHGAEAADEVTFIQSKVGQIPASEIIDQLNECAAMWDRAMSQAGAGK